MENGNIYNYFIIGGLVAIIVELFLGVSTGFDLLLLGVIAILSGALGFATGTVEVAFITMIVLSIGYVFVGRALIKNKITVTTRKTNIDAVLGSKGVVVKKITGKKAGQVKVDGEIWRAESSTSLDEGEEIKVESVSGVTLKVS